MKSLFDGQPASTLPAEPSPPRQKPNGRPKRTNGKTADNVGDRLQSLFSELVQDAAPPLDADAVRAIVDAKLADFKAPKPDRFVVQIADVEREIPESAHTCFGALLKLALAKNRHGLRFNVLLVGPAGCGKTYAAGQVAKSLGLRFGFLSLSGGISECHLTGRYLPTGAARQECGPESSAAIREDRILERRLSRWNL